MGSSTCIGMLCCSEVITTPSIFPTTITSLAEVLTGAGGFAKLKWLAFFVRPTFSSPELCAVAKLLAFDVSSMVTISFPMSSCVDLSNGNGILLMD
jgi:hypothetical protein